MTSAGDVPAAAWVAGRSGDPGRSLTGATFPEAVPAPAGPAAAGDPLYRVLAGLAMRDLTLVESLLQVAEQLESQEENPGQLELLFRIDHLATRMRRNSENLLVLAGQGGQDRGTRDFRRAGHPAGVVRVLVSDLADRGTVRVHPTAAGAGLSDTVLLERVLRGLQTIRR